MKPAAKKVRDYFLSKSDLFHIDSVMLEKAISALTESEYALLMSNDDDSYKPYHHLLLKIFYRQNDLCAGHSDIADDGTMLCSAQSSITELDLAPETFEACYAAQYIHIEDIDKEDFTGFTFYQIADITAAILKFEAEHQVLLD